jgi:hypothetical protein
MKCKAPQSVCVCARVCVCVCGCVCMHACVRACLCVWLGALQRACPSLSSVPSSKTCSNSHGSSSSVSLIGNATPETPPTVTSWCPCISLCLHTQDCPVMCRRSSQRTVWVPQGCINDTPQHLWRPQGTQASLRTLRRVATYWAHARAGTSCYGP